MLLIAIDENGRIATWNHGAEGMFGWEADEVIGHPYTWVVRVQRPFKESSSRNSPEEPDNATLMRLFHRNGSARIVRTRVIQRGVRQGDDARIICFHQDATRQIALEVEQTARHHELERSNAELESFARIASHDLREPLRMVSSYARLLDRRYRSQLDADAGEFLDFIIDGADRLSRMIQDLLHVARVGSEPLNPMLIDTEHLVCERCQDCRERPTAR